jgi:hypothetical protein
MGERMTERALSFHTRPRWFAGIDLAVVIATVSVGMALLIGA